MSEYKDVRCPVCKRLLFRQRGQGMEIEIICPKCKAILELSYQIQINIVAAEKPRLVRE